MKNELIKMLANQAGVSVEEFEAKVAEKKAAAAERDAEQAADDTAPEGDATYRGATLISNAAAVELVHRLPHVPEGTGVDGGVDPAVILSSKRFELLPGGTRLDELRMPAEGNALIIDGDLTIDGLLKQDFRAGCLLVLGNLSAKHIVTTAQLQCAGDLKVFGTLFGNCTNYSTDIFGKTTAATAISAKEHYFCFYGGAAIATIVDVYGDTPNLNDATHCGRDMLAMDDAHDEDEAARLLESVGSLLRTVEG